VNAVTDLKGFAEENELPFELLEELRSFAEGN
jgi:hypothetical protein